jgi:hypothetical protein
VKIEMDDNSFWLSFIAVVGILIVIVSLGACYLHQQTNQAAIKAGLTEVNDSISSTHWAKP